MNKNTVTVVAVVLLLVLAAVFYERNKSREIQVSLAALTSERDSLDRQVKNLTRLVAEVKQQVAAAPVVADAPRPVAQVTGPVVKREEPVATPGVSITAPKGWAKNGKNPGAYVVGVDETQTYGGMPSAYVKSLEPGVDGFGGIMQMSSADDLAGKRVRLSGYAKTEDANDGGGHLWLRVDGKERGVSLQFDNMDGRAIMGTTDWRPYSVVLDVPAEASALAYGFFVQGSGKMWVSGAKIEPVGQEVASTNLIKPRAAAPALPKTPVNLSFGNGP